MSDGKNLKIELNHDVLARKVYERASREDKLRLQIERMLRDKHEFFQSGQGSLLTKDELGLIRTYLNVKALAPGYLDYIRQSDDAVRQAERKKTRLLRIGLLLALATTAIFAFLGLYALRQSQLAKDNAQLAELNADSASRLALREKTLRVEADGLNDSLQVTNLHLDAARREALRQADIAEANALQARLAEGDAKNQRDSAERRAVAYRLLVLAMDQQKAGNQTGAFQIARRAAGIYAGSAILDFLRTAYNALPEKNTPLRTWKAEGPLAAAWPLDQRLALLGKDPASLQILEAGTWTAGSTPLPGKPVAVAVSADARRALVAGDDNTVQWWDLQNRKMLKRFPAGNNLPAIAAGPGGQFCSGVQEKVGLYSAAGDSLFTLEHPTWVSNLQYSPDGRYLLVALTNYEIWLWDLATRRRRAVLTHQGPVNSLQFSTDGRLILTASNDETARLWDLDGRPLAKYSHYRNDRESVFVTAAALSADARYCLSVAGNEVRLWDRRGARLADYSFPSPVLGAAFLPDGAAFYVVLQNGEVRVLKSYAARVAELRPVDLPEIDRLGYEMPFLYWVEAANSRQLWIYARHYAHKSDNFKEPAEHLPVLVNATRLFEKAQPGLSLSGPERDSVSRWYGNLSWYQIQTGQFREAERSARRGLAVYPAGRWINTNLALALVLSGRFGEARPIYVGLKDQAYAPEEGDPRSFRQVFLDDLDEMKKIGIGHGDFGRVRALLR